MPRSSAAAPWRSTTAVGAASCRFRFSSRASALRIALLLAAAVVPAGAQEGFVGRRADTLTLGGAPWYFQGANAYALPSSAARGDTAAIEEVMGMARSLGLTVLRTWAFYDAADSADPAVIQSGPGRYRESGLRGLDAVIAGAARHGLRLILALVNNWDDYGGMNQYVRWRFPGGAERPGAAPARVTGARGQSYLASPVAGASHDDFYTDSLINLWYRDYVRMLLSRVNTRTGIAYRDDPAIMAWELANEPRSSDRTGTIIGDWIRRSARWVKSLDPVHLVGTGEEGFDVSPVEYGSYAGSAWLLDGTAGVSFRRNTALDDIDFGGIHLYPDSWNLAAGAGNAWIRDHLRIARQLGKPLIAGEYGVRADRAAAYDSWLTTLLLDGGAGAAFWQLGTASVPQDDGYVVTCGAHPDPVCAVLRYHADRAREKSGTGSLPPPPFASFLHTYPNPCRRWAILRYSLEADARVSLSLFTVLGERVAVLVDGHQGSGERRELLEARRLPSGVYVSRLQVQYARGGGFSATGRIVILR